MELSDFKPGDVVLYLEKYRTPDEGVVTSTNSRYVFVRYGKLDTSSATKPEDLVFKDKYNKALATHREWHNPYALEDEKTLNAFCKKCNIEVVENKNKRWFINSYPLTCEQNMIKDIVE